MRNVRVWMGLAAACLAMGVVRADAAEARLVIRHARIFTMAEGQKAPFVGYVEVGADGTIAAIGAGEAPAGVHGVEELDAKGAWVIPGFVSAHSHLWQAAYRGLAEDKELPGWIDDLYGQRASKVAAEDFYWFCLLGSLDHLEHGVTAAYDFAYGRREPDGWGLRFDEAQFRAETGSGIRFVHGYQPEKVGPGVTLEGARGRLKGFLDWTGTQKETSGFLGVMLNGSTAFNDTYQQAVMEAALMNEFKLGNQSHYLEPPQTQGEERSKFRWFMDSGLLRRELIFGHFIHPDDYILLQTAKAGASMAWNPLSNGRLASGVPDIPKYLKLGVRVGMGVDGEASADVADPFENMRTGMYAIRDRYEDASAMSPYQVLWLHTMGSADVLGVKAKLGSLEVGKFGDLLVIDPERLGAELEDPYANLVFAAGERDIERVYVGGVLTVEAGKMVGQDMGKVEGEVRRRVLAAAGR